MISEDFEYLRDVASNGIKSVEDAKLYAMVLASEKAGSYEWKLL